jgi:hypothetical protein
VRQPSSAGCRRLTVGHVLEVTGAQPTVAAHSAGPKLATVRGCLHIKSSEHADNQGEECLMSGGPRLIERADDQRASSGAFAEAISDAGRMVVISGQPGTGKTALVRIFLNGVSGAAVLAGRADALKRGVTLAPVVEAVQPYLDRQSSERRRDLLVGYRA